MSAKAFEEWLCKEMPQGTIIGDPKWWAPRIERQVHAALLADEPEVEGIVEWLRPSPFPDDHAAADALLSQAARIKALDGELAAAKAERDALIELLRRAQRRGPIGLKLLRDITAALAAAKAEVAHEHERAEGYADAGMTLMMQSHEWQERAEKAGAENKAPRDMEAWLRSNVIALTTRDADGCERAIVAEQESSGPGAGDIVDAISAAIDAERAK